MVPDCMLLGMDIEAGRTAGEFVASTQEPQ